MHGGPGTGKSYAINLLRQELFEERLGWTHGKEFQIVAFQAVNADPLEGDTIHKALGLAWHGHDSRVDQQRILDLAQQTLQWRWLIIDEISMLSAEMLARLDARCLQLILDVCAAKYGAPGKFHVVPFGGLNVILCGDLWQLLAIATSARNVSRTNPLATRHQPSHRQIATRLAGTTPRVGSP